MKTLKVRKEECWQAFVNALSQETKEKFSGNNDLLEMSWTDFLCVERKLSLTDLNEYEYMVFQALPAGARASLGHFAS